MADTPEITKRDLEQLRGLIAEIETLARTEPQGRAVLIFYKDYRSGKGIPKTDVGIDDGEDEAKELAAKIRKKRRELVRQVSKIEDWLETVEDAETRAILREYYLDGKSQEEIGKALGYSRSAIQYKLDNPWRK